MSLSGPPNKGWLAWALGTQWVQGGNNFSFSCQNAPDKEVRWERRDVQNSKSPGEADSHTAIERAGGERRHHSMGILEDPNTMHGHMKPRSLLRGTREPPDFQL